MCSYENIGSYSYWQIVHHWSLDVFTPWSMLWMCGDSHTVVSTSMLFLLFLRLPLKEVQVRLFFCLFVTFIDFRVVFINKGWFEHPDLWSPVADLISNPLGHTTGFVESCVQVLSKMACKTVQQRSVALWRIRYSGHRWREILVGGGFWWLVGKIREAVCIIYRYIYVIYIYIWCIYIYIWYHDIIYLKGYLLKLYRTWRKQKTMGCLKRFLFWMMWSTILLPETVTTWIMITWKAGDPYSTVG